MRINGYMPATVVIPTSGGQFLKTAKIFNQEFTFFYKTRNSMSSHGAPGAELMMTKQHSFAIS